MGYLRILRSCLRRVARQSAGPRLAGRRLAALALGAWLAGVGGAPAVLAQVEGVTPSPEQLEMLQSLPPEQRAELMNQAASGGLTGVAPLMAVGAKPNAQTPAHKPTLTPAQGKPAAADGAAAADAVDGAVGAMHPYGYDIFRNATGQFEPEAAIPVPNDYVLGPGDKVEVQLYGNERQNLILVVGRDGKIRVPKLGPVQVGGMRFGEVKDIVETRVAKEFVGTQVSLSMGELRSIRVFVLGDVEHPGSYLVSALATLSNALLVAGGPTEAGTLRDLQLKRSGEVVVHLDAYDLLLRGDTRNDARLLAGDVVFVPPVGNTVAISGEVRRPAIYEMKPGSVVADLLYLSGGLKPAADPKTARITRISEAKERITLDVNLASKEGRALRLRTGDGLTVIAVRPALMASVELVGEVFRPQQFQYREGLRLSDIVPALDDLQPGADPAYVVIRRQPVRPGPLEVRSADLRAALAAPGTAADLLLQPRDVVRVTAKTPRRASQVAGLVDELRAEGRLDAPARVVNVGGNIIAPGSYPLEPGMRVADLLRAGGTLDDSAYGGTAELVRYDVAGGEKRQTALLTVDLAAVRRGEAEANLALQPYDLLTVKQIQNWADNGTVVLKGEVRYPGSYPIRRGETLSQVIARAGGYTPEAYLPGAVFTRAAVREQEQQQLDKLATRMQSDLTLLALQGTRTAGKDQANDPTATLTVGQALLADLRNTKTVGRVVVDLPAMAGHPDREVLLLDKDQLAVPRQLQSVTVLGEVQSPVSHLWSPQGSRDDYLGRSGGLTRKADAKRIYVVHADGSVESPRGGWLRPASSARVLPGDTIVVPVDAERVQALPLWTAVTQIIYNLAIAATAVSRF